MTAYRLMILFKFFVSEWNKYARAKVSDRFVCTFSSFIYLICDSKFNDMPIDVFINETHRILCKHGVGVHILKED